MQKHELKELKRTATEHYKNHSFLILLYQPFLTSSLHNFSEGGGNACPGSQQISQIYFTSSSSVFRRCRTNGNILSLHPKMSEEENFIVIESNAVYRLFEQKVWIISSIQREENTRNWIEL